MAACQKLYPRATVKKIVKAHSKRNVTKNVDVLIFLDYELFLQTLMKEATINARAAGERGISAKSVKKVTEVCILSEIQRLKLLLWQDKDEQAHLYIKGRYGWPPTDILTISGAVWTLDHPGAREDGVKVRLRTRL
ncbi:hypothetical protein MBM_00129 [Drepanopeziza brunnea f. sp. 'multigermtubi' MB_m1]|uniref:Transcription factor CBF/NF-Y/archaeal histone domain-containing protein n=1 Tax=Marssonina brunnea f. sp. multigermtubi (strain MB_m1) TaxID=1072389 RepID=K1X7E3_MARBU|nr:uncharacterized protein MBM_00129 [Drepanopeziza brunnea f. sp. 'multigermtubi' MB_m1]EKD21016.1 hypothetical protein MBM_00129 [Drepanopeziza brunnea f. sp. 'multigermtubi' MB_m1]